MENIGIEPSQLLTQVINFLLMVILLTKLLYKPVLKALDERKKKIEESLKLAEEIKLEADKNEKKRQEIINKSKQEAKQIIEEAKKTAKQVEAEIIMKAHNEAEMIIEKGKKDIEGEREQMEKQLRNKTIEIASEMAEKVIGMVLSDSDHHKIINNKLKDLKNI
ncbi:ATP synthase F0 subunit B [Candidatus Gottesmanbacteria bacterium CG11_big_fil_rev_8_21_14_0_20_37_11]|uniref:ATP synthase subunit b n=3 Tax=Candidatus Gottesmaniibacteriota TaxID=1752720 RepID=A0A2M7RSJ2_9BACT|nr:MAG: ATP synthase F0 subunit B [Candidatus Gottesmanbacteria bacterium CG1_02_37_22]PIP32298.1 MAG: ATP synthase F0 subunit B [Candidatus Gottesmanbacteria bacterium CG23_combo_of_CG06-09_8_20_14_all_37_19]PIR07962.1 MAG: ATP synthase F0 subunit B [Candidatus Gottesmanbacteria bacterium CG11_big_fil_rev_8_21_14_0_20_37_11]PIZ03236.1 MAG: ATP synthase F0 subunit B [Candidatus Gottesmanbacteria bacterium CG_4_10_14_0_8_um_filter_37_24]